jgi:hypothetical protein
VPSTPARKTETPAKKAPTKKAAAAKAAPVKKAPTKKAATAGPVEKVKGPASYFPSIEKTYGKPIAEWKKLIRTRKGERHMQIVNWLKAEYGMGHGHATAVVIHTLAEDAEAAKG